MTQSGGGGRQPTIAASLRMPSSASGAASAPVDPNKAQPVLVHRGALQTFPGVSINFMGYDIWDAVNALAGVTVIGAGGPGAGVIQVPAQTALDISEINFVWLVDLHGGGQLTAIPDYWLLSAGVRFGVVVGERQPWDQFSLIPVVGRVPGWVTLNQNVLASWSDTPVHLVVPPNQSVYFTYTKIAPIVAPFDVGVVGARFRGRWIPEKLWRELQAVGDK